MRRNAETEIARICKVNSIGWIRWFRLTRTWWEIVTWKWIKLKKSGVTLANKVIKIAIMICNINIKIYSNNNLLMYLGWVVLQALINKVMIDKPWRILIWTLLINLQMEWVVSQMPHQYHGFMAKTLEILLSKLIRQLIITGTTHPWKNQILMCPMPRDRKWWNSSNKQIRHP